MFEVRWDGSLRDVYDFKKNVKNSRDDNYERKRERERERERRQEKKKKIEESGGKGQREV